MMLALCCLALLLQPQSGVTRLLAPPLLQPGLAILLPDPAWFKQPLDHFNVRCYKSSSIFVFVTNSFGRDRRVWRQRYWVDRRHQQPGGPVLLLVGGEGEASPAWLRAGALSQYAAEHGAAMYVLEHRYYGHSRPTANLSTKELAWLSADQALADAARFIRAQRRPGEKWVALGGSYPVQFYCDITLTSLLYRARWQAGCD